MDQISVETEKLKQAPRHQWGCLKLLLIPILLAVACYGGMWVFARYGGEWMMDRRISPPPASQLIRISYKEEIDYTYKSRLYFRSVSPEEAKIFWESSHRPYYYKWGYFLESRLYDIHAAVTHYLYPDIILYGSCGGSGYFSNREDFSKEYPDLKLPDNTVAFEVDTCWRTMSNKRPLPFSYGEWPR